jgi:kynureninase
MSATSTPSPSSSPSGSALPLTPEERDAWRPSFPILQQRTYLNSCSLGALSKEAEGRLGEFLALWHTHGASAWYEHWMGRLQGLRGQVATFMGAGAHELALSPSTSVALASVAESVDWTKRPRVVIGSLDFPTLGYQFAARPEVELVVVPSDDGVGIDPDRFAEAVDERTAFLATSHVYFTTGYAQDLPALADIARRVGALSLIDGYQGAGQIPLDVKAAGVDIYTTGPLKWLLGGPGLAYLYVREELIPSLTPRLTSWFAMERMFEFDLEDLTFRADARRFEMGTPALATVHMAQGGQDIIDAVGIHRIEATNRMLTDRLVDGLSAVGFALTMAADRDRRTALLMVQHAHPAETVAALATEGIIVDHRPGHVRISPHFYNTEDEVDQIVASLARLPR